MPDLQNTSTGMAIYPTPHSDSTVAASDYNIIQHPLPQTTNAMFIILYTWFLQAPTMGNSGANKITILM
jgi:hypothetical protein